MKTSTLQEKLENQAKQKFDAELSEFLRAFENFYYKTCGCTSDQALARYTQDKEHGADLSNLYHLREYLKITLPLALLPSFTNKHISNFIKTVEEVKSQLDDLS